ncbi:hypothetical protein EXE43_23680 [Halorubrum sp. SS5]|uniref:hypothetical protein n=1 Tax=unclassified Halorubrum TaxID=2642239 RepID=UPI0010F4B120|nr:MULTISPECIES: hypothetical protein [unclassified Halorubrum]TKX52814.1 hypothetical protein EXE42_15305 [Halorubrum sp. SP3]TKX58871.1 hypothetical protein EXE44_04830 [Halorubrum sp. SS7]TKX64497.1 hypothetical protein EXE45_16505 [Halorubrum sp. SP9]TKX83549.1 hypothetical protein EXE43_23680 [Halorubrum sp. SS5]
MDDVQAFTTTMSMFTWVVCVTAMILHVVGAWVGWWPFEYWPTYLAATIACLLNVVATGLTVQLRRHQ